MAAAMPRTVLRPDKPKALFVAAGAFALMVFGIVQMVSSGGFQWFLVLWVTIGLYIIVSALIQGFGGRDPATGSISADDRPVNDHPGSQRPAGMPGGRPMAVVGAVIGAGILIFGALQMRGSGNDGFLVFWIVFGVAIIAFNLWTAFRRKR